MTEPVVTCNLQVFKCRCVKPHDHLDTDDVHACDPGCGGSWRGDTEATMEPVTFPNGLPIGLPVAGGGIDGPMGEFFEALQVPRGGIRYPFPSAED